MNFTKRSLLRVMVFGTSILGLAIGLRLSFGLFLQPMSQTLGWGRDTFAFAIALQTLGIDELGDLLAHWVAGPRGLAEIADASHRITDDNLRLEFTAPLNIQRRSVPEILHLLSKARAHRAELDLSSLDSLTRRRTLDRLVVLEDRRRRDRPPVWS